MDVRVVVSNTKRVTIRELVDGLSVTRCAQFSKIAATSLCPRMATELSSRPYDILHLHLPDPMAAVAYLVSKKPTGHRLIVSFHSEVVRQRFLRHLYRPLEQVVLKRASFVLVGSPSLAACDALTSARSRCKIVPFGIELDPQDEKSHKARTPSSPPARGRLVLAVGRLVYYKGFEFLIEAMSNVDGQLAIVGDGPLRASLEAKLRRLDLRNRVFLLGDLTEAELSAWYRAAQIFCLPSIEQSEAFGLVQLEAMARSLPVVNTRLENGVNFVSPEGECAFTVEPRDPRALARALTTLLDDPTARERLGAAGRARVLSKFSANSMASAVTDLYHEALGRSPLTIS
jgi:glycosyltransferase involved in cell wall biosynthesis